MLSENLTVEKATKLAKKQNVDQIYYKDLENRLKRHFGLRVEVEGTKNRGSILLRFADLDELDRLLEQLGVE